MATKIIRVIKKNGVLINQERSVDKQSGDKQSGDKQSDDKRSGDKRSGDKRSVCESAFCEKIDKPSISGVYPEDVSSLSPEQRIAYTQFVRGANLFITGPGGTGKTRLIHHFISHAENTKKEYQVCAMTGCAALLLGCKARTLHSWSGIKLAKGPKDSVVASVLRNKRVCKEIRRTSLLIIDEISMMSQKIFEIIDALCREVKKSRYVPFGGIQVIMTGDFYQLPPVGSYDDPETTNMCFESPLWAHIFPPENVVELKTIFRQNDPTYIDILSQVRRGYLDAEHIDVLNRYVKREYNPADHYGCVPTKLFSLRNKADYINNLMFSKIEGTCYESKYKTCATNTKYLDSSEKPIPAAVLRECYSLSEAEVERELDALVKSIQAEEVFQYKVGALVMCTKNINLEMGICNGTQGVIVDVLQQGAMFIPIVQFTNGVRLPMPPIAWQSETYPTLSVHQIPLRLAWALTIHKIQGATMDIAEMDIGHSVFEYGQIYVALSRIKSLDGLYLLNFRPEKIRANPKVVAFYQEIMDAQSAAHVVEAQQVVAAHAVEAEKDINTLCKNFDAFSYKANTYGDLEEERYSQRKTRLEPYVEPETPPSIKVCKMP